MTEVEDLEIFTQLIIAMDKRWFEIWKMKNPDPGKKS